ncbi:hypothetical protein [Agrobacterium sp. NPDC090283]|uniref:hypothetical protein n=1 Tax=Agrobacterium sp. NPDC090283 TaxID=3363920 RepID=UPI00383B1C92
MKERNEFEAAERLLNSIGDNPSFDISEFIERISVAEDWGKLIVAHIYLDHIITEVLNTHLDHPTAYFNGHRSFAEKLSLCQAMGYFRDKFGDVLKAINNSRNKFAHKLVFHVSDEEKRNLFRTLTTERPTSEVTRSDGFEEFLFTIVIFAEISRSAEERHAELSKEQEAVSKKILELLIANKDMLGDKFLP